MTVKDAAAGKTTAIIAYCTLIGTLIALFMNLETKNDFARFHIRQAFGIHLLFWLLGYVVGNFDSLMVSTAFWLGIFVLWLYGFIGAVQEKENQIPVIGEYFQRWFTFIK
ncbi:DUF4870 domain-containing protein [Robertkochia aurantiaca]|uniref:DUF4870 domain-containing protein n=1 Tax=Robertkochia aurantiaca TaxID=2873700 RepID=UPI001CCF570E|nr:hypothetical protein [Robertkochia sp. 3YJGBD-33]